jgi:hypothetical protein
LPHTNIPIISGATFRVRRWILSVTLECLQCEQAHEVTLVRASHGPSPFSVACPSCGAVYDLGGMAWDVRSGDAPRFAIADSAPMPRVLN